MNIYKRDLKGLPRYRCKHPVCNKTFNIFTGTSLRGTSFSPKEVILCVSGILEKMSIKELSNNTGIPERRLKKYYDDLKKLSRRKTRLQFPVVKEWEAIFDKILTAGETRLPSKDYHNLRRLVFKIWETAGYMSHWKCHLENIVDWDIIKDLEGKRLLLTTKDQKQFELKKMPFKKNDPETGKTIATVQSTKVSMLIRK